MSKSNLLKGDKFSDSHSTIIEAAVPYLKELKKLTCVTKIVIGPITRCKSAPIRYKTKDVDAGLQLTVRGPMAVQKFYVYTNDKNKCIKTLDGV